MDNTGNPQKTAAQAAELVWLTDNRPLAALSLGAAVPIAGYGANAIKAGKHIAKATKPVTKTKKVVDAIKAPVKTTREATERVVAKTKAGQKVLDKRDKGSAALATATGGGGKATKAVAGGQIILKGEKATRPINPQIDKAIDKGVQAITGS